VVLDESESIAFQFFSSTIQIDKIINFSYFQEQILAQAKKVLLMDADISDTSLELINFDSILAKTTIINNMHKRTQNKKTL
jgi:hypothetical protein